MTDKRKLVEAFFKTSPIDPMTGYVGVRRGTEAILIEAKDRQFGDEPYTATLPTAGDVATQFAERGMFARQDLRTGAVTYGWRREVSTLHQVEFRKFEDATQDVIVAVDMETGEVTDSIPLGEAMPGLVLGVGADGKLMASPSFTAAVKEGPVIAGGAVVDMSDGTAKVTAL